MMRPTFVILALGLVGVCGLPSADGDDDSPKKKIVAKAKKAAPIPNFNADLELSFASLENLPSRIKAARKSDPVGLASAAKELAVAEAVSGKKASLTSETLAKEAIALATLRFQEQEIRAVALLTGSNLSKLANAAEKRAAERQAAIDSGEKKRGVRRYLTVVNMNRFSIVVYVNGERIGRLPALSENDVLVGDSGRDITVVEAESNNGYEAYKEIRGAYTDYELTFE